MNSGSADEDKEMIEKAKQLLQLTDLIEKYPQVVSRRVAGLVYIIIAGGISFATLIFMSLQNNLGPGDPLIVNMGFVLLSLFFSWVVGFRLVVPLTKSYPQTTEVDTGGRTVLIGWTVLVVAIIATSFITFQAGRPELFPPTLQLIMGIGFTTNYIMGRREGGVEFYSKEHAIFAGAIFLSIIPMLLLPAVAYIFLIVVDMGGIYVIGIYMLITAERLLLESKGQG
jgi:hypothetical protein